ncbi:proteasome complex subunit Rpn13 ubiquitin receptor-domain-containing protein, partial [Dendryphion nanum]
MSIQPLITFKAGKCDLSLSGPAPKVKPIATPGLVYMYMGDDFPHLCWRPRNAPVDQPELDLLMIPGDASFTPYLSSDTGADSENLKSPTDGRVFVLKFNSSSQRHLFWLQSKSQHPKGDPSWFSERDLKVGQIIDLLLNGEEVDVLAELAGISSRNAPSGDDDEDETMEDVEGTNHSSNRNRHGSTGGAGPGATGGDIREEGSGPREGGADGGRAAAAGSSEAQAAVQNFLRSIQGGNLSGQQASQDQFTTLLDLLSPPTTIPVIDKASPELIDALCAHLPPITLLIAQEIDNVTEIDPESEEAKAVIESMDEEDKKDVLKRVFTSPQFRQSLGSLTVALRDGGLPNVSSALKIDVENGGYLKGGAMPIGGGDAIKAFVEGVKNTVENEEEEDDDDDDDDMDTN